MAQYAIREIATLLKIDDEPPPTEAEIIVQDASTDVDDFGSKSLWHFFDQQVAQASARNSVSSQMQQYLCVNDLEIKQDPLEWRKRNCHVYPHISKLAKISINSRLQSKGWTNYFRKKEQVEGKACEHVCIFKQKLN